MRKFPLRRAREMISFLPPVVKLLVVFTVVNVVLAAGSVTMQLVILRNTAVITMVNVAIYWDASFSSPVEAIDWGNIEPGGDKVIGLYIKNEGNSDVFLSIQAVNLLPSEAVDYIMFSCDYLGQIIKPQDFVHVTLSLSVSPTVQEMTSFSFDVAIEARAT